MFKYFFFLNLGSYPIIKIIEIGTNFVIGLWGLFASPMLIRVISEEEKNKCKKTFTCFLLTYAKRLTAATHNDNGKRESYGRY
jgi:K+-sensing histidine kinase KdpD